MICAELKYPEYDGHELKATTETLFTDKELFIMLDYDRGSRNKVWNNFFNPIGKGKFY